MSRRLDSDPSICEVGGKGLFLPLFGDDEQRWPQGIRGILYGLGLGWLFLGVSIIADVFMAAIEKVTSKTRYKKVPGTTKKVTVKVWNATVANLTLMALGSSAPEILLSVIELLSNEWYAGALGPSTIVGSAAFNLLCILAVCVYVIPPGEQRSVKEIPVFAVTASCSIFAYAWLVVILQGITPNAIDIWEGLLTFLFFPVLIVVAFVADKGYFSPKSEETRCILTEAETPPSRAAYRQAAVAMMTGRKKNMLSNTKEDLRVQFSSDVYSACPSQEKNATISVQRDGSTECEIVVDYRVVVGTGISPDSTSGSLTFPLGSSVAEIQVPLKPVPANYTPPSPCSKKDHGKIMDLNVADSAALATMSQNTKKTAGLPCGRPLIGSFSVELMEPRVRSTAPNTIVPSVGLGPYTQAQVELVNGNSPGAIGFLQPEIEVSGIKESVLSVVVFREGGATGEVKCSFKTEQGTAMPVYDYEEVSGEVVFANHQVQARVQVKILAKSSYEESDAFRIVLENLEGGATFIPDEDGGTESKIAVVTILARPDRADGCMHLVDKCCNVEEMMVGTADWRTQFVEAVYVHGSAEDQQDARPLDWFLHVCSLPFKLIFALVPPTTYFDGWLCFVIAIGFIGMVTAVIGDMAGLFGCVLGLPDPITAITFVALGTSLPDTFASKSSAVQDPYADNSIGNVTGSNSVNVFLGLGLPWLMGGIYWNSQGATDEWKAKYDSSIISPYPSGAFIVEAGDLGFSVTCFLICCFACLGTLVYRRKALGAELGGAHRPKKITATFFVLLWIFYVTLSSWKVIVGEVEASVQVLAIAAGLGGVVALFLLIVGALTMCGGAEPSGNPTVTNDNVPCSKIGKTLDTE